VSRAICCPHPRKPVHGWSVSISACSAGRRRAGRAPPKKDGWRTRIAMQNDRHPCIEGSQLVARPGRKHEKQRHVMLWPGQALLQKAGRFWIARRGKTYLHRLLPTDAIDPPCLLIRIAISLASVRPPTIPRNSDGRTNAAAQWLAIRQQLTSPVRVVGWLRITGAESEKVADPVTSQRAICDQKTCGCISARHFLLFCRRFRDHRPALAGATASPVFQRRWLRHRRLIASPMAISPEWRSAMAQTWEC